MDSADVKHRKAALPQPSITIRLEGGGVGEDQLSALNDEQREAVTHQNGPLLVIAGAGTGKTRVITERIAHILSEGWCENRQILGLTFTDKAAGEMEERLDRLMPLGYEAVPLHTFHSFCEKILRRYGIDIGISPDFRILEGVSQWQFVKERLFEFDLSYYRPLGNPTRFIQALIGHFGRLKEELISPADYFACADKRRNSAQTDDERAEAERLTELAGAYQTYQEMLEKESRMDFADLHGNVINLLEKRPNILRHLQQTYRYILVDEYQDTNIAQNRLVDILAGEHRNLTVVGDDDQSIYKFRGAAISNILQFEEKYPEAKKVVLTRNYRSSQAILDVARTSIQKNNPDRLEIRSGVSKKLTALHPGSAESVRVAHFTTLDQEVGYVADEILKSGTPLHQIALLVRANRYAQSFVEEFRRRNIPYQFLSERGLYDKPEVRELTAILRVLANPADDISFYRVLRLPAWNLSMETIARLIEQAKKRYTSVWTQVKKEEECRFLMDTLSDLLDYSKTHTAGETLYRFTETIRLYESLLTLGTIEAEEKITNIASFFRKIHDFERENEHNTVIDFVAFLDMAQEAGENPSAAFDVAGMDGVRISTVHGVKGLEFHTVFVANLVNRRFPSDNRGDAIELPDELVRELLTDSDTHTQEERRLFYVACTRAKENLHLLWSDFYGPSSAKNPRVSKRSRFLDEIIGEEAPLTSIEKTAEGVERFLKPSATAPSPAPAREATPARSFSYSQISAFSACPRRYQYAHLLKITEPPTGAMSFGSTLHNTLLEFYRLADQTKQASLFTEYATDLSLDKLLSIYNEKWIASGYESGAHMESAKKRGREILERFHTHFKERVDRIEFLEKGFTLNMGDFALRGRIDRADRLSDDTLEIIDYKTGKARSQKEVDKDIQLMIYAMAAQNCFGKPASRLTLYFLDDDLKVSTEPDVERIEKAKEEITETVSKIRTSDFSPTPSPITCKFCPYRKICDAAA